MIITVMEKRIKTVIWKVDFGAKYVFYKDLSEGPLNRSLGVMCRRPVAAFLAESKLLHFLQTAWKAQN